MRSLPATIGFFLAIGLVGCSTPEADHAEAPAPTVAQVAPAEEHDADEHEGGASEHSDSSEEAREGETRNFQGAGRVRNLTPSGDFVIIEHGPIEGFMHGMTMPFPVKDSQVLDGIALGDSIKFTLAVNDIEAWISEVNQVQ